MSGGYEHPGGPVAAAFAARIQAAEAVGLAPAATRSYPAERAFEEPECGLRTPFQRDRDRIVHCKAFRRLKHKTQVFVLPVGDHYRTRLTHTLEVTQIGRTVARALALNEDLVEAIGLGHDIGHAPFGHIGEEALDERLQERFGEHFRHNEQSLRVVEVLEREGRGLNLTAPVRDGIVGHSWRAQAPTTPEAQIIRFVDRIAYINHDIDDAVRGGVLHGEDLPDGPIAILGETGSQRIDTLVHDLVECSAQAEAIVQSERIGTAMDDLRTFMFERVYLGPEVTHERGKIIGAVGSLFDHFCEHPDQIPDSSPDGPVWRRATDYIAGMTDRYAVALFQDLAVPTAFTT